MGYHHKAVFAVCGHCKSKSLWSGTVRQKFPARYDCSCGYTNHLSDYERWPNVPRTLYFGHEKNRQMKLYPVPPECPDEPWALPFSIRSFVYQASRFLGGCHYVTAKQGTVMGEDAFTDRCVPPEGADRWNWELDYWPSCHMVAGWTVGAATCSLWEKLRTFCQNETEQRFLHTYLSLAKDRHFPMLIPQVRVGIGERRRPDFVAFVPLQYWRYNWYAIEIDGGHPEERAADDQQRDEDLEREGYQVIRVRSDERGYIHQIKALVEKFDVEMRTVESDPWRVAVENGVLKTELRDDYIPF